MTDERKAVVDQVTKDLVDKGKLIEAGWAGLRLLVIPDDAPEDQLREMRMAFFAGAQHVFGSIMSFLEEGEEATENDMRRMSQINAELTAFADELKMRFPNYGTRQ